MKRGLISFDIDGTLEVGDPRGAVSLATVRLAGRLGYLIGSCSDRTRREQRELWQAAGIEVDFIVVKQELPLLRERFQATTWLHVGDSEVDRIMAARAGFDFLHVLDAGEGEAWLVRRFAGASGQQPTTTRAPGQTPD